MSGRASQDILVPALQPTTNNARVSQDILLPTALPTQPGRARVSQDVIIDSFIPTQIGRARVSQDVILTIFGQPSGTVRLIGGNYQDAEGNPIAFGMMTLRLSSDQPISGIGQIARSVLVQAGLDANGAVLPGVFVYPNNTMQDTTSYYIVNVYNANGQLVWGPQQQQITNAQLTFDVGTWTSNPI